jgi:hypothetical protein
VPAVEQEPVIRVGSNVADAGVIFAMNGTATVAAIGIVYKLGVRST